jgi:hypothetical protein
MDMKEEKNSEGYIRVNSDESIQDLINSFNQIKRKKMTKKEIKQIHIGDKLSEHLDKIKKA